MSMTVKMVASEILMCGLKQIPVAGVAFEVVDSIRQKHELFTLTDRLTEVEVKLSRFEQRQRDLVAEEMRAILGNLSRPDLNGASLTEEMHNLRQIQEQGWHSTLFEGLFRNSSHLDELGRNPHLYGRLLRDDDTIDPQNGIHVVLEADRTRILELSPFAFSQLLAHQSRASPEAKIEVAEDIWAFPKVDKARSEPRQGNQPSREPAPPTFALEIPAHLYTAMVSYCVRQAPRMCGGILAGIESRVSFHSPLRNVAPAESCTNRYLANRDDLSEVHATLLQRRLPLLGIYMSRPRDDAIPSRIDLRENNYGEVPRILVSLVSETPNVRVWKLNPESYEELRWRVVEPSGASPDGA